MELGLGRTRVEERDGSQSELFADALSVYTLCGREGVGRTSDRIRTSCAGSGSDVGRRQRGSCLGVPADQGIPEGAGAVFEHSRYEVQFSLGTRLLGPGLPMHEEV